MLKVCEVSIDFRCSLDKFLEEVCDSRYREGIIEGVVRVVAGLRVKERWFSAQTYVIVTVSAVRMSQFHLFWTRLATNPGNAESDLSRNLGSKHVAVFCRANNVLSFGMMGVLTQQHLALCQTDHCSSCSTT
jgi:hypothetical protein